MAPWRITTGSGLNDWIYWRLLVQFLWITINYNRSNKWMPKTRSILILTLRPTSELPASELDSYNHFARTLQKHSLYCWPTLFSAPLPSKRYLTVLRVCFWGNVFSHPLPNNGHGADHIENISCNTFSIVACTYFGRCLEMGLHVTIYYSKA
jgi:hypothetical protein